MKTLFKTLAELLGANDDCTIVIRKNTDGRLVVSTNVCNRSVNDAAKTVIAPFIVNGTPEELDNEFADLIAVPVERSTGIQTSMENFEASEKAAQAKSKAAAELKKKEQDAKSKAEKAIQEAKKLADAKKFAEAVKLLETALAEAPESMKKAITAALEKYRSQDAPDIFNFGMESDPEPADEAGDGDSSDEGDGDEDEAEGSDEEDDNPEPENGDQADE